ncbi:MAG: hypothetical protein IJS09_01750 [Treponema sp.]|nr:hypothetical protein [Treponema sp.]
MKKHIAQRIILFVNLAIALMFFSCNKDTMQSHFKKDATTFNKELALLSFDAARATGDKTEAEAFFTENLHFDTFLASEDYDAPPSANSIGFVFAHTKLGDNDLIAIMVRGFNYGAEWASNFRMGKKGNHAGFASAAEKIYAELLEYTQKHFHDTKLKFWISGYSRGGGVANVLAHFILSREDFDILQKNMYVYTLEAPQGLTEENALPYPNVFNIINSADLVPHVAPNDYGLYRCGNDVDIYTSEADTYMREAEKELAPFTPIRTEDSTWFFKADSEQEFLAGLLIKIMEAQPDGFPSFATREKYANTVQDHMCYLFELFMNISSEERKALLDAFKGFFQALYSEQADSLSGSLQMIMQTTGLYGKMISILTSDTITYDDAKLQKAFMAIVQLALTKKDVVAGCMTYADNLKRLGQMHEPATTRILLEHYEE